ncbi:MAG TPA: helix-turn-helix transcriptional regulator [Firmicutes bacterium]|nr:helix-turn-helix transcriptional regulator [Bacillota bacterium]
MNFGERLKELRIKRNLRQEDIGKIAHVGKSTVSQWESGIHAPDLETVIKLANALNVTVDYLLGRTDDPTPPQARNFTTIAAHRTDDPMADLPEEARRSVEEFLAYIRQKYGKKDNGNKEG